MPVSTRDDVICDMMDAADLLDLSRHFTQWGKRAHMRLMGVVATLSRVVDKFHNGLFDGALGGLEKNQADEVPMPIWA